MNIFGLMVLGMMGTILMGIIVVLYHIHMIKSKFFDIIINFTRTSKDHLTALEDLKMVVMKAYGINEMPRPGKNQPKIKPTYYSDSELYDMEKSRD